jgi:hypothetical protein
LHAASLPPPPATRRGRSSVPAGGVADGSTGAGDDVTAVSGAQYRRSKARYETNNHVDDSVFEARWQRAAADADWDTSRMPRCRYKDTEAKREWKFGAGTDGKPFARRFMVCVACGVAWPCTTRYFTAQHASGREGGIDSWLQRSKPGGESLMNSSSNPCNKCRADLLQTGLVKPEGWRRSIMRKLRAPG